mgnify:CR=1 FL=1|tara:strand:+ start:1696 stop:2040 length:345 start_codon:yes stop_codon:yes gene_type:complete
MSKTNTKINKLLATNIKAVLSYINNTIFPFESEKISDEEMSYILTIFIRSGKTLEEIKTDIIDTLDGKDNELSTFIKDYPSKRSNSREDIVMLFIGITVSFIIFYILVINNKNF